MKLYISEKAELNTTEMQLEVMEKELRELNDKYPLEQEQFDIKTIYSIKTDDGAETYIYIRNNTSKEVTLEHVPIYLKKDKRIVAKTTPDFKILGRIPPYSATPFKVEFNTEEIYYPKYISKGEASIEGQLKVEDIIISSIENIPENLDYYQRKFLKNYVESLKNLRKDTFDINTVSVSEGENGSLNIVILIRNGYSDLDIVIKTLPIQVYNEVGVLVYNGSFKSDDLKVKKEMSKIFNINLDKEYLLLKEGYNYEEFKVEFK